MSAKIVVQRGKNSGEEYWIEDEVSRIGSRPDCTFVVRGIPGHCLTLLYRAGQYSIVNRSDQAIDVAGEPLLPMATMPIHDGEYVSIGRETVLRLDVDGDPAPSHHPHSVVDADENGLLGPDDAGPDTKQKLRRYALFAAALPAAIYLLFGNPFDGEKSDSATGREFHQLLEHLQSNAADNRDGPARLARALQRARVSEIRGDEERALAYYEIAKDMVTEDPHKPGCAARNLTAPIRTRTYELVKNRLGALD